MVSDMLNTVLEKEKDITNLESQAREQAEKIIADAQEKAKSIIDGSKAQIAADENAKLSSARASADEAVNKASEQAKAQSDLLKKECEAKLDETIKEVKRIILE